MKNNFWETIKNWKEEGKWIELSREVSLKTPHHSAFPDMKMRKLYDYPNGDGFQAHEYTIPGQYGTHIDAPVHMSNPMAGGLDIFSPEELVLPLCVINLEDKVEVNPDYMLTVEDIKNWEAEYGKIPENAFVAFQSGWGKRKTYEEIENCDEYGVSHYPGWSIEALKYLREERKVKAIGHEPADTDPAFVANKEGWVAERYWLSEDNYQVELLVNLEKCTATGSVIIVSFPKVVEGSGFTARCFAIVPK